MLEEIDYRELYLTYSSEGRNPAVSPKNLFIDGTKEELRIEHIPDYLTSEYLSKLWSNIILLADSQGIGFVHGIGNRKTEIRRQAEAIEDFKDRQREYSG